MLFDLVRFNVFAVCITLFDRGSLNYWTLALIFLVLFIKDSTMG